MKHNTVTKAMQYMWTCTTDNDVFITATVDTNGKLQNIGGKNNAGSDGAGLFSACLSNCSAKIEPQVAAVYGNRSVMYIAERLLQI
jgi:hypothetical protein